MIFIGCAGWSIPGASKSEFPGEGSHLERYARVFSCAEINTSFYRSHRASTWARWAEAVPRDFRFSVKAPRSITHEGALQSSGALISAFVTEARSLGEKLGCILLQTPPKLEFKAAVVGRFFAAFRSAYSGRAAIEPRHASWFTQEADDLMKEFDMARVAADPAPDPRGLQPGGSSSFVYYRWHGSPRKYYSSYSEASLAQLAGALPGAPEAWCIFDNTASGAATQNALLLTQLMRPSS